MSVVFLFVGQCGNQVGESYLSLLASATTTPHTNTKSTSSQIHQILPGSPLLTSDGYSRCIFVDTEPKVVQRLQAKYPKLVRKENVVYDQSGRGNNWALGYFGVTQQHAVNTSTSTWRSTLTTSRDLHKRPILDEAIRAIHGECRRAEFGLVEAIIVVHSVAGGTGSGLGSKLIEVVRRWYTWDGEEGEDASLDSVVGSRCKALYLVSASVLPFEAVSDVSVQYMNMALSLAHTLPHVDAALLFRNEFIGQGSFALLNEVFGKVLFDIVREYGGVSSMISGKGRSRPNHSLEIRKPNRGNMTTQSPQNCLIVRQRKKGGGGDGSVVVEVVSPTQSHMKDVFRVMLRDVAMKLSSGAFVFQYLQVQGMTEELLWDSLKYLRTLIDDFPM